MPNSAVALGVAQEVGSAVRLLDSHVHLAEEEYDSDLPQVLERARQVGVVAMVVPATNLASWKRVLVLAERYREIFPALGIQPHDASEYRPELLAQLETYSARLVAVGEIGLDFHYDLSPRPVQIECFRAHLRLARRLHLPVILHCREAEVEFVSALREEGVPQGGVVHCCTCAMEYVEQFLQLGLHIGVTGMVTFPKLTAVHQIATLCPLERLLIETDSPYLAPKPHRGQRNEPSYVARVAQSIAELRGCSIAEIGQQSTANAVRLFGLAEPRTNC